MAYVLMQRPINREELAQRILANLKKHDSGICPEYLPHFLYEDAEKGEGGVRCKREECEAAVAILLSGGLVELVDKSSRELPNWGVLQVKKQ